MTDTAAIPGGAHPAQPTSLLYRTLTEDGQVQGCLWVAATPTPGGVNAGALTHLPAMPTRLAWLAQGLRMAVDRGMDPEEALAEMRSMGGTRWTVDATSRRADTMAAAALALESTVPSAPEATDPEQPAPAKRKRAAKPAAPAADTTPADTTTEAQA